MRIWCPARTWHNELDTTRRWSPPSKFNRRTKSRGPKGQPGVAIGGPYIAPMGGTRSCQAYIVSTRRYPKCHSTLSVSYCPTPHLGACFVAGQTTLLCLCSLPAPRQISLASPVRLMKVSGTMYPPPSVAGSFTALVTLAEEVSLCTTPSIGGLFTQLISRF